MSDTAFMKCHLCGEEVRNTRLQGYETLPPWKVIEWHKAMIAHVRREHLHKRRTFGGRR